jgi:nucleotide-binding universal stress UspA family protein
MDNILCPIDFSPYSMNALEYAASLLKVRTGNLFIIHVFSEDELIKYFSNRQSDKETENLKDFAVEKLKILTKETEASFNINCSYILSIGDVNLSINKYTKQHDIDYVVMGTQGNGYNKDTVIGSRTMRTVESSEVPILTVPIQAQFNGLQSVVYASDYSKHDKLTLQRLVSFIYNFKSRIKVVHISRSKNQMSEHAYSDFKKELLTFLAYDKMTYHLKEYKDDISHGIEEFVNEQDGELLVLLKRKRNFFESLISSSVSTEVSYFSSHPLLIFQEPEN